MIKRGNKKENKKGLSPIIATVLLILLVLVLAGIIFTWMRGFVSEQLVKGSKTVEQACQEVDFDVQFVTTTDLEIVNRGNVPISSFEVKIFNGGDSDIIKFSFSVDAGQAISESFNPGPTDGRMIIYPIVLGNVKDKQVNKMYTCLDKGKTVTL